MADMQHLNLIVAYLVLFAFIALGFFISVLLKKHSEVIIKKLSWILLYISLPIAMIDSITLEFEKLVLTSREIVISSIILVISSIMLAYYTSKILKLNEKKSGIIMLCSANWNAIFIPFPLMYILAGTTGVAYASVIASIVVIFIPIDVLLIEIIYEKRVKGIKSLLKSSLSFPPLDAVIIALILGFAGLKLRIFVPLTEIYEINGKFLSYSAMIVIGMLLQRSFKRRLSLVTTLIMLIRFLFSPIIALSLILMLRIEGAPRLALLVESIMPPAAMNPVIAAESNLDAELVAESVFIATLISIFISLPFILLIH